MITTATPTETQSIANTGRVPKDWVPLRGDPLAPDPRDGERIKLVRSTCWSSQDDLLRHRDRQIEENIRMLAGQQWAQFNSFLGRWVDVTEWMTPEELAWRQRPVFNRLLNWFILTHARLTENPPVITFVPGPDRIDAESAEMMDVMFKTLWRELGVPEVIDRMMAWLIPCGRAHLQSRLDPNAGDLIPWIGVGQVPVIQPDGQPLVDEQTGEPVMVEADGVPFAQDGTPQAVMTPDGLQMTGEPHAEREGGLVLDVLSPLQVRMQWGPHPPHLAEWHATRAYLSPEEIYNQFGLDLPADTKGNTGDAGELERMLFGTGFFGASDGSTPTQTTPADTKGFLEVTSRWQRPCTYGGMEQSDGAPGGRLTIVTRTHVLYDGPRPVAYPHTSPIRTFDFVRLPGRPSGSSPQEAMNPVQRMYNRVMGRIGEHVNLVTDPIALIDQQSGIQENDWQNQPGNSYVITKRQGVEAVSYVKPPELSGDVYKLQGILLMELTEMGSLQGTQGETPTTDASGELVKELRFNSDRFLGPTVRRAADEIALMAGDWKAIIPTIWDSQKVLRYTGDDNVARSMIVLPDLFKQGNVNIQADAESMLPEGRGERQSRIYRMYMDGLFGMPGTPEALRQFFDLARFPHLSRAAKPGGTDRTTAEQENAQLMQGVPAQMIPVFPWYDDLTHLSVHEALMKTPEFLKLPPETRDNFTFHWQAHQFNMQRKMMQAAVQQAGVNQVANPQPPEPGGGGNDEDAISAPGIGPGVPTPPTAGVPGGEYPTSAGIQ